MGAIHIIGKVREYLVGAQSHCLAPKLDNQGGWDNKM